MTALLFVIFLFALTVGAAGLSFSGTAAITPTGWVPVDYGNAQVSVPASWAISTETCDGATYLVNRGNDTDACSVQGASGCRCPGSRLLCRHILAKLRRF